MRFLFLAFHNYELKNSLNLLNNDIKKCYQSLLQKLKEKNLVYVKLSRSDRKRLEIQKHHITPKHAGGSDDPVNLIYVSIQDHALLYYWRFLLYRNKHDKNAVRLILNYPMTARRKTILKEGEIYFTGRKKRAPPVYSDYLKKRSVQKKAKEAIDLN